MVRRLVTATVLAAGVMLGAAPALARAPELPQSLEVTFGDDVSAATRWHVDRAVQEGWERFAQLLDDLDADLVVVADADTATAVWAERRGISYERAARQFTARSGHYAGLATTGLTVIINDAGHAGATIHELVHLVQHALCDCGFQGPRWMSEGAAEYFTYDVERRWGIDAEARGPQVANSKIAEEWAKTYGNCGDGLLPADGDTCRWATESLHALEGAAPFDLAGGAVGAYDRAGVAFQYLVDQAGESAYFCFLETQATGSSWQSAFRSCFGMEVDLFYERFDRFRERGFLREAAPRVHFMI